MVEPATAGVLYAAEHLLEGAVALAKGLYHPTLPLRATYARVNGVSLPRASGHSLSVVKGRAYVFGGQAPATETTATPADDDSDSPPAKNDVHIVILPFAESAGVTQADYRRVKAQPGNGLGPVPAARSGHTSVAVGEQIYIFGGQLTEGESSEEELEGRVWVFDTTYNKWSFFDPAANSPKPPRRAGHVAIATDKPDWKLPPPPALAKWQQDPDPAVFVPEPPQKSSWGTVFIAGGKEIGGDSRVLNDVWAFDIRTRTWRELPSLEHLAPPELPNLAYVNEKLYTFLPRDKGTEEGAPIRVAVLNVSALWSPSEPSASEENSTLMSELGSWSVHDVDTAGTTHLPDFTTRTSIVDVTTGQGRAYLFIFGQAAPGSPTRSWSYQLPPDTGSAARAKDEMRAKIKEPQNWGKISEVQYQILDEVSGDVKKVEEAVDMDGRREFAAAKDVEVDGSSVVVWGGRVGEKILGDGFMVTLER